MLSNENGGDGEIRTHGTELTVRRLSKALPSTTRARLQVILKDGGGHRIRTCGPRKGTTVFKTVALNRSANPPHRCR